jgi:hypothetical protein
MINNKRTPITADRLVSIAWVDAVLQFSDAHNLYDINCPMKANHNLANQSWNKMVGRRQRRPAAAAGGRRINSRRPASPRASWDIMYKYS